MYSAYKLNTQGQGTPSPVLNQFVVPCPVLTVSSWPEYRFLRRQVRWSGIPISKNFPRFVVTHTVKGFTIVNEAKYMFFREFPCFFYDPADVGNLISGSSAFSKSNLSIWNFSVHILLKSSLKDFEHYFASTWKERYCMVVWTFLGIALLWNCNENWHSPVMWPLLSYPNLLTYWIEHYNSVIF